MNKEEVLKNIKKQENKYFVKIHINEFRDESHLDCLWYGGEVARIEYRNYKIVIGAYGDIECEGRINGKEIYFKDRNNSGSAFSEIGAIVNDNKLHELLESNDPDNYLRLKEGNWFEVDLINPKGKWIDLCGKDNVLENDLIDNLSDVSEYFQFVENEIGEIVL